MKKTITQTREAIYSRLRELMQLDDTDDVEHALLHGDRNCRYLRAHGSHDWEAWRYSYAGLSEEGKKCRICGRSVVTRSINAPDT